MNLQTTNKSWNPIYGPIFAAAAAYTFSMHRMCVRNQESGCCVRSSASMAYSQFALIQVDYPFQGYVRNIDEIDSPMRNSDLVVRFRDSPSIQN